MTPLLLVAAGFGLLTLVGAVYLVLTPRVLHAALALLLVLLGAAGLFVLLGADVPAVAQLLAYVGGVLVLTLFGIMLSQPGTHGPATDTVNRWSGWLLGALAFAGLAAGLRPAEFERLPWRLAASAAVPARAPAGGAAGGTPAPDPVLALGTDLLTTAVLPVELASVLLLVALVAAVALAGESDRSH